MNAINPLQDQHDLYRAALYAAREKYVSGRGSHHEFMFDLCVRAGDELRAEKKDWVSILRNKKAGY